jgi:hypothetical protein
MMLQVVASPMVIILMTIDVSFKLLENIYSTGVNYNCHNHQNIFLVQATGIVWDKSFYFS